MVGHNFELRDCVHRSHCEVGIGSLMGVSIKQCYNWSESSDITGQITARYLNNEI